MSDSQDSIWFRNTFETISDNIATVIRGKREAIDLLLLCLIAEGHVLIEDVPGVGKTLLAKSLATSIDCVFKRVQFTPDLLPSDITGVSIWDRGTSEFVFKPGAVFTNVLVGDEINRASPKTQAALLEAMEERQVTSDGITHTLAPPFMVVATQNPLEHEGTYPLPEAQLDRFMARLGIGYPDRATNLDILETHGAVSSFDSLAPVLNSSDILKMISQARFVHASDEVRGYLVDLLEATRNDAELLLGASPRAGLHLLRLARARAASQGRDFVTPNDIKVLAVPVLSHRVVVRPESMVRGVSETEVLSTILGHIKVPGSVQ
jgi:MoxR-like ATPase